MQSRHDNISDAEAARERLRLDSQNAWKGPMAMTKSSAFALSKGDPVAPDGWAGVTRDEYGTPRSVASARIDEADDARERMSRDLANAWRQPHGLSK